MTFDLTAAQRWLLQIVLENQFGRIENVPVRAGQPLPDVSVRIVRASRLGGNSGGTAPPATDDFELKRAVHDLFEELIRLGDGTIVRLEFRHGLPFLLEVERVKGVKDGLAQ
jgi:hypothetical protein